MAHQKKSQRTCTTSDSLGNLEQVNNLWRKIPYIFKCLITNDKNMEPRAIYV